METRFRLEAILNTFMARPIKLKCLCVSFVFVLLLLFNDEHEKKKHKNLIMCKKILF
jgi:hypothetical protein